VRIVGGTSSGTSAEVVACSLRSGVDRSSRVVDGAASSLRTTKERRVGRSRANEGSEQREEGECKLHYDDGFSGFSW
jgi:hypothetical protein